MNLPIYLQSHAFKDVCPKCGIFDDLFDVHNGDTDEVLRTRCGACLQEE